LIYKAFFYKIYQCLIKNIFLNQLDEQKRPGIAALAWLGRFRRLSKDYE
jgi:hypothetical protein